MMSSFVLDFLHCYTGLGEFAAINCAGNWETKGMKVANGAV